MVTIPQRLDKSSGLAVCCRLGEDIFHDDLVPIRVGTGVVRTSSVNRLPDRFSGLRFSKRPAWWTPVCCRLGNFGFSKAGLEGWVGGPAW